MSESNIARALELANDALHKQSAKLAKQTAEIERIKQKLSAKEEEIANRKRMLDAGYSREQGMEYAISELGDALERFKADNAAIKAEAIREAVEYIRNNVIEIIDSTPWGWDGDCGVSSDVDAFFDYYASQSLTTKANNEGGDSE